MKFLSHLSILMGIVLAAAPPAQAQYGFYGPPDTFGEGAAGPAAAPHYAYPGRSADSYDSAGPSDFRTALPQPAAPSARYLPYDPAAPQGRSVISQMLEESPGHGVPPAYPATSSPHCGVDFSCGVGEAACATDWKPSWYAGAAWLTLGRNEPNALWTTYEAGNNANQLSTDVDLEWGGGGEVVVGRTYSCGRWILEGTYWQLSPQDGEVSVTHANNVSTPLDFSDVVYANPALAGLLPVSLFDGAAEHRVRRRSKVHDIELNMIRNRNCGVDPLAKRWDLDWSIGVRYFHFEEDWVFRSLELGGSWANRATIGHLEDHMANNLVGFQLGFDIDYQCFRKLRLFVRPDFGVYNNHITNTFLAYRGDGENFAPDPASGVAGSYPVRSSTDKISFLTEIDLGLDWQFHPRWSATLGYRLVVATGIGLAQNQVPPYVVDIPEIAAIDDNGELVLHGAFAGLTFSY